jgi:site-specific DNA recombinase
MIRAAIYARFSSDLQNDKSINDQIALCREVCAREGMAVISTFEDRAISGTAAVNRPGFQALMQAAESKSFNVIVAEDMDRIFRDQADYHAARKRLDFLGVAIHTAGGKVGKLDGSLRALMGEMFIENLVVHVRRGMDGVVRDGRHAGGRAFGYRPIAGKAGELEIVEAEAEIIRGIFADYVDGKSPRDIAGDLNAKRIKPPRGDNWNASTINGNLQRGAGILLNEIYAGRIVWNKVRMIKDPATGKRVSRPNPKEQHRIVEAPHLRIVAEDVWQAAQRRKKAASTPKDVSGIKVPRILSGLIRCGACGGGMVSQGQRFGTARLQCSNFRESGVCNNGRRVKRDEVERLALDGLRRELAHPACLAEYVAVYNEERKRLARGAGNERAKLDRRAGEIGRELNRAIDAIVKAGVDPATLAGRIKELEQERESIAGKLAAIATARNVITLHPAAMERYRADLDRLAEMLPRNELGERDELAATLRNLVSAVIVHAKPNDIGFEIEIRGRLEELLSAPTFMARSSGGVRMVAGEGLEPPTPGL